MNRKILLLEPNYQNKYPPIGLMKISTYHRLLKDNVSFYKGDLDAFIVNIIKNKCVSKLNNIDSSINWNIYSESIAKFIRNKNRLYLDEIPIKRSNYEILLFHSLSDYANYYRKKLYLKDIKYDRVYVATLFTFYWDITIKTIEFAKNLVDDVKNVVVGGVMASLIPNEILKETGIKPIEGLLDRSGILDKGNRYNIDNLTLDYSILDEIDYEYPTKSAYFTFMTKGCTRACPFCSVPKIEPKYKEHIKTKKKFEDIRMKYGEQQNLLLMDNNVLASPKFKDIIAEIKKMGFVKGALYTEPNQFDISIRNLKNGYNDKAYTIRSFKLIKLLFNNIKNDAAQNYYNILDKYELLSFDTVTKTNLLNAYPFIKDIYEKYRPKTKRLRYVDFNQGVDCRYITDEYMKLISEIPIRPLRIAFDYISLKDKYIKAVKLAAKYGIKELSNYILYNFKDNPDDLYERLKINVELGEELGIHIYSFPMKYIPLYNEEAKNREYIGSNWNKKFIRAIQSILNVTKGIVAPGRSFFEKAFGKDIYVYRDLLYMPETYIVYRKILEEINYTQNWYSQFRKLNSNELPVAKEIIESNDFTMVDFKTKSDKILDLLKHYRIKREDVAKDDKDYKKLKSKFDKIIKNDNFIDLTLTYDFDDFFQNSSKKISSG